ncbi:hypothetical protein O3P69_009905 [Scylla paramamosain]|uniref:Uncharacterized protein n=1 Tax=Scylla paramamosain TaxID=85552 RepID=A0AAW0SP67_SCYPA
MFVWFSGIGFHAAVFEFHDSLRNQAGKTADRRRLIQNTLRAAGSNSRPAGVASAATLARTHHGWCRSLGSRAVLQAESDCWVAA